MIKPLAIQISELINNGNANLFFPPHNFLLLDCEKQYGRIISSARLIFDCVGTIVQPNWILSAFIFLNWYFFPFNAIFHSFTYVRGFWYLKSGNNHNKVLQSDKDWQINIISHNYFRSCILTRCINGLCYNIQNLKNIYFYQTYTGTFDKDK